MACGRMNISSLNVIMNDLPRMQIAGLSKIKAQTESTESMRPCNAMTVSQSLTCKDLSNIVDDPQRWLMERLDG